MTLAGRTSQGNAQWWVSSRERASSSETTGTRELIFEKSREGDVKRETNPVRPFLTSARQPNEGMKIETIFEMMNANFMNWVKWDFSLFLCMQILLSFKEQTNLCSTIYNKTSNRWRKYNGRREGNMREENSILFWDGKKRVEMRWSIGTRIGDYTLRTMKTSSIYERIRRGNWTDSDRKNIRSGRKVEFEIRAILSSLYVLSHRPETREST